MASATSLIISTIFGATKLGETGILIHTALVEYPGLSLSEKQPLVNGKLSKPNLILDWTSTIEVRDLIKRNLNNLFLTY